MPSRTPRRGAGARRLDRTLGRTRHVPPAGWTYCSAPYERTSLCPQRAPGFSPRPRKIQPAPLQPGAKQPAEWASGRQVDSRPGRVRHLLSNSRRKHTGGEEEVLERQPHCWRFGLPTAHRVHIMINIASLARRWPSLCRSADPSRVRLKTAPQHGIPRRSEVSNPLKRQLPSPSSSAPHMLEVSSMAWAWRAAGRAKADARRPGRSAAARIGSATSLVADRRDPPRGPGSQVC